MDVDERGVTTSCSGVFDRLKACGTAPSAVTATLIDYDRDKERVAQACGRVEIRRVPLAFGAQCFVWTTPLHCAAGGYNLSFRSGVDCDAPKPPKLAYLFEYEGKERLVFKVTASALVHVQLLVECFRRAGILPQGFGLGWRNLACDNKLGKPLFMSDTNLAWRSPTNPEQWVEMCQLMDADLSDRKVLMPTTGESLYFSLCRGNIVGGDDSFYLSFAVNGRTMSVDTVRCTMWDLL